MAQAVSLLQRGSAEEEAIAIFERVATMGHEDAVVVACRAFPSLAIAVGKKDRTRELLASILAKSRDVALGRRAGLEMPRELSRSEGLSPREREVHQTS